MEKILLIVPPCIEFNSFVNPSFNERTVIKKNGRFGSLITDMPLGMLCMSAYVKKHSEVETRLIDFNILLNEMEDFEYSSFKEFFQDYLSEPRWDVYYPSIIGISSLFTSSYKNLLDIAQCCRDIFPNAIIIAGGGVPTNLYNEIFNASTCFNALCYGEGEKPLLGLIKADDKLNHLEENPSWITRRKVENNQFFQYDFIENLDEIPFCDYSIIDTDKYGLNPGITAYASIKEKKQNFHVMTSRGCPHRCCFCSSHTVHGRKMRYYSVNRIREDFTRLRDEYEAKIIIFQDDHFVGDKKRALKIIEIINELQLTAVFQNGVALYALDRKMLEALKSAGVDHLVLSVESGSERVLREIMHKPINLNIVKRVADDCHQLNIYTSVNVLIGLPGETKQDIEDTRLFLKTITANWFMLYCANPLVGSEMYEICKKRNYLKEDHIGSDYKKAVVETEEFSAEYILEKVYSLNLELNFVGNSDFRLGNYKMALKGFKHVINVKNDHVFAYYCAAKCYEKLGNLKKAHQFMNKAKMFTAEKPFWRKYVDRFNIPL